MKRLIYLSLLLFVSLSCAKTETVSSNLKAKRYFDAWLQMTCPAAYVNGEKGWGWYLNPDKEVAGTGEPVADSAWVQVRFTARNMGGTIVESSEESAHRQVGDYFLTYYYGPVIWNKGEASALPAGLRDMLKDMRLRGKRQVFIPGWLNSTADYSSAKDYFNDTENAGIAAVYDVEIVDATNNITRWGVDSLVRYVNRHPSCPYAKSKTDVPVDRARFVRCAETSKDTTQWGFWFQRLKEPEKVKALPNDTTVYVDYVARRLDGIVFDTNIKDTARKYDFYSSSATYSPMKLKLAEKFFDIKMVSTSDGSESSLIQGFTYAVKHMQPGEWGVALFHQGMAYAQSSQAEIPAYCPLMFELRLVDAPQ
ncbi:MAG: FKBP-type peptidyl-prolyl cis-trans isomerase [Bacteroidales bacterium]|nr:FKBP-type peptidyl-prolyl cis-trans isomerase [Bacteroidales bacterium]